MTKPLCRMTIKDLLDQIDEQEARANEQIVPRKGNPLVCALISIDDAASYLDIHPEILRSELKNACEPGEPTVNPIPFFRDLDVRL